MNIIETSWFNFRKFYDRVAEKYRNKPVRIVELGVWKGHSVCYLAYKLPQAEVFAVDLFENSYRYDGHEKLLKQLPNVREEFDKMVKHYDVKNIKVLQGCSWEMAKEFEDGSVDFLFIDADHSFECVRKDIQAWLPKMKGDGIIAGHDWEHPKHPGVKKAVIKTIGKPMMGGNTVWWKDMKDVLLRKQRMINKKE
jgi:hypothetical protein